MGRTPRENVRIEQRRQQVAERYLKGAVQATIACELAVSQATIAADLKAVRRKWRESRIRDFDEAVTVELAKLAVLEREAWAGWERSQQSVETVSIQQRGADKHVEKTVRQQTGDPRYLEQVQRSIVARRALLGLDAPTRIAPTSPDGEESYLAYAMRELVRLAEQTPTAPVIVDSQWVERELRRRSIGESVAAENHEDSTNLQEGA
jgi:hypothetical protein